MNETSNCTEVRAACFPEGVSIFDLEHGAPDLLQKLGAEIRFLERQDRFLYHGG
jgi:hypothetical protein